MINHNGTFKHRIRGISLMELCVTMGLISILLSVAIPSYQQKLRVGRRLDATLTLMDIEQQEEIYRNNHPQYGTLSQVWGNNTKTPKGFYSLNVVSPTASGYVMTATAVSDQKEDKAGDVDCSTLTVTVDRLVSNHSPTSCW